MFYISLTACKLLQIPERLHRDANLPICTTLEDISCGARKLRSLVQKHRMRKDARLSLCKKPCRTAEYQMVMNENPNYRRDFVKLFMTFLSNEITVMQEYKIYDFNDIVSSVGGSLGLFLGFSCFELCRMVSKWLCDNFQTTH